MATAERLGEIGGTQAALDPSSPHPRESEGVLYPEFAPTRPVNTPEEIHIAYGEVVVGSVTTCYKGFFPENRTEKGIGYAFSGFGGILKSSETPGKWLARYGLANLAVSQVRKSSSVCEDIFDSQAVHVATAEAVFVDIHKNTDITTKMPDGKEAINEEWLLWLHSMGGLAGTKFALAHPDEAKMVAMLKTVGINKSILLQIMKSTINGNAVGAIQHEFLPYVLSDEIELSLKNIARIARHFGVGWPARRDTRPTQSLGEMISCLTANTRPVLQKLGEIGTKRLLVEAGRDVLVAPAFDIDAYVDRHVVFPNYGHMMPQHRPGLIAETILSSRHELQAA